MIIKENFVAFNGTFDTTGGLRELDGSWARGLLGFIDVTAVSGTSPTVDLKLQGFDEESGKWFDVTDGGIPQLSSVGQTQFMIYPGINDTGNDQANVVIPRRFRFHGTIGGSASPSITFTFAGDLIE